MIDALFHYLSCITNSIVTIRQAMGFLLKPFLFLFCETKESLDWHSLLVAEILTFKTENFRVRLSEAMDSHQVQLVYNNLTGAELQDNWRTNLLVARHLYEPESMSETFEDAAGPFFSAYMVGESGSLIEHAIFINIFFFHCLTGSRVTAAMAGKMAAASLVSMLINTRLLQLMTRISWIGGADLERIWSGSGADGDLDRISDLERISDLDRISGSRSIWSGSHGSGLEMSASQLHRSLTPNAASAPGQKASSTDVLEWGQLVVSLDKQLQQRRKRQAQTGLKNPGKQPTPTSNESAGQEVGTKAERKMDKLGEVQADMRLPQLQQQRQRTFLAVLRGTPFFDVRGSRSRSGSSRHRQSSSFVGISVGQRVDQPGQIFWHRRSLTTTVGADFFSVLSSAIPRRRRILGDEVKDEQPLPRRRSSEPTKLDAAVRESLRLKLPPRPLFPLPLLRWAYAARQGSKGRPGRLRLPASERLRRGMTERRREHVPSVVAEATAGASSSWSKLAQPPPIASRMSRRNSPHQSRF
uniref:Cyclic nucleotide-binding domain-containing protein n=1 Tax=Macrostomum lignano TaxID=282301 RepID=A0A1I8F2S0_9PLAT